MRETLMDDLTMFTHMHPTRSTENIPWREANNSMVPAFEMVGPTLTAVVASPHPSINLIIDTERIPETLEPNLMSTNAAFP